MWIAECVHAYSPSPPCSFFLVFCLHGLARERGSGADTFQIPFLPHLCSQPYLSSLVFPVSFPLVLLLSHCFTSGGRSLLSVRCLFHETVDCISGKCSPFFSDMIAIRSRRFLTERSAEGLQFQRLFLSDHDAGSVNVSRRTACLPGYGVLKGEGLGVVGGGGGAEIKL